MIQRASSLARNVAAQANVPAGALGPQQARLGPEPVDSSDSRVPGLTVERRGLGHQPLMLPRVGEHSVDVLAELGFDTGEVDALLGAEVVRQLEDSRQ